MTAAGLENLLAGAPLPSDPFAESMSQVHHLFVAFLDNAEMNGTEGVPTKRALDGISKRFKWKKGEVRPSFIDTGMFQPQCAPDKRGAECLPSMNYPVLKRSLTHRWCRGWRISADRHR